jgi:phosphoribosylaminoimidazolecarboxamide formyltransferase/IMP cyclohydrolase
MEHGMTLQDMYKTLQKDVFPDTLTIELGNELLRYRKRVWALDGAEKGLRYGENPDQPAALYELAAGGISCGNIAWRAPGQGIVSAVSEAQMLQAGKHPGKTNLTDVDNGVNILQYLTKRPAALILKHNNPCGAAWSDAGVGMALHNAFWCDRIAAFGGAVIVNRPLSLEAADIITANYFEVVAAPDFEHGALDVIKRRKNLRIFKLPALGDLSRLPESSFLDIKSMADGGLIVQKSFVNRIRAVEDFVPAGAGAEDGSFVSARAPSAREAEDLLFAWAVEAGVISNSVIFAKNGATAAIGAGEQDRVGCVELAIHKAHTKYADALAFKERGMSLYELMLKAGTDAQSVELLEDIEERAKKAKAGLQGAVLVSDGFFPFRDGVDVAIRQGIQAIAQPGGALRDMEVIAACNEATPQVAMVFTGQRAFKH